MLPSKALNKLLASTILGSTLALASCLRTPEPAQAPAPTHAPATDISTQEQLQQFYNALLTICKSHVDPAKACDNETNLENAINGVLSGLDAHSNYMNEVKMAAAREQIEISYAGVGAPLKFDEAKRIIVASPPDEGTPAARANLKEGDVILKIDENPTGGMSLDEAVKLIRGNPDTIVNFLVTTGQDPARIVSMKREKIDSPVITGAAIGDVGYIRIPTFYKRDSSNPSKDALTPLFLRVANVLKRDIPGLSKVVIDLRNNAGGYLDSGVNIAGSLLKDRSTIVTRHGRPDKKPENVVADNDVPLDIFKGVEIVALVDGGTASASEVAVAAWQDNKRVTVMGPNQTTFGKGSIQMKTPFWRGEMKLTTERYFTPLGRSIQGQGIRVDVFVRDPDAREYVREAELGNALPHPDIAAEDLTRTTATCSAPQAAFNIAALPKIMVKPNGKPDLSLICAVGFLRKDSTLADIRPVGPDNPLPK